MVVNLLPNDSKTTPYLKNVILPKAVNPTGRDGLQESDMVFLGSLVVFDPTQVVKLRVAGLTNISLIDTSKVNKRKVQML